MDLKIVRPPGLLGRTVWQGRAWLILHTTQIGQVWEIGLAFCLVWPLRLSLSFFVALACFILFSLYLSFPSFSFFCTMIHSDLAFVYVTRERACNSHILTISPCVFLRESKKGSLSYLLQGTSKGIGLERAICAIFEDVFMSILATPAWTFILHSPF